MISNEYFTEKAKFKKITAKSSKKIFFTWIALNKHLMYKMEKKIMVFFKCNQNFYNYFIVLLISLILLKKIQTTNRKIVRDIYIDKIDLDKLFREKEKNTEHMNDNKVKLFFLRLVLNSLRLSTEPKAIQRVIKKFLIVSIFKFIFMQNILYFLI